MRVAVPSPLSVKVTPRGRLPVSDNEGVGVPVELTVNVLGLPSGKLADHELVIDGALVTERVKF